MITATPRPYQVEPLQDFYDRKSILLAFDTGLGKTYCAIAAAEDLLDQAEVTRVLLVVPASLKYQWAEAIARFTDMPTVRKKFKGEVLTIPDPAHCMVIDGPPDRRRKQYKMARETPTCGYVIIGYDNVCNDARDVFRLGAEFAVLDEASEIKTMSSKRTIAIKETLTQPWRMALTATPIDNRPDELFSIMEWVDASVLGDGRLFDLAYIKRNHFGDPTGYRNLGVLRDKLGKAMYRKSVDDPDVAPFMPRRDFIDWPVRMDGSTAEVYARIAWDLKDALDDAAAANGGRSFSVSSHYAGDKGALEGTAVGRVMSRHLALEMLCDHPEVLYDSAWQYFRTDGEHGSKYAYQLFARTKADLKHSPKLRELAHRLGVLLNADEHAKVIIFTRFRKMQEIIMAELDSSGWGEAVEYHGGLSTAEQTAARARFMNDPDVRFFVSTHAGERGTDLPVANWLINYDPVWSSGQADQINGRHMRTSSEHDDIFVANMFVEGSVEQRKLDQQDEKRQLSRAVVDGFVPKTGTLDKDVASLKDHVDTWLTEHDPDGMFRP